MALIDVTVAEIIQESPTVRSFRLAKPDGSPLGTYLPGAHIDVVGPTSITRQYSLFSTPDAQDSFAFAVKREENSRGGSAALHEVGVGDVLRISSPRNLLSIATDATHHVLVAAGIGITPMLSLARYMDVHGISFELHYFARSEKEAAFLPLLRDRCPEKLRAHLGVARQDQDEILGTTFAGMDPGAHVYTCGPDGFMTKVVALAGRHVPAGSIHLENFHAAEQPDASENSAFEVELEGETYQVPADRSIVEVLQENGCDVDTSCQEGICGTCIMQVLAGTPIHRDNVLTQSEKESGEIMAVCVSRAAGERLVLDYY
ncbi:MULTISPECIES: PDR/VanB family oxidoreductase [Rhodococcus]|uniref:PDR/VanB family oxidoreductase n=1 Tax=Rhodococcus TaxID=1827 RepID=UPI00143E5CEA|nr:MULTISPECIES: PDR/VanB family oxidoreductase [Rhodococcus]MBC2589507.1 oxidoreductase [Rhodococcus aetherivorans]QIX52248.1 oxidoreductase [Rhodococcus sp. DMU1]QRI77494.1 oxidoreductase [Rhodococcus aetherivorans]QSE60913.1 oxidoreductase [Rhodococcus sp. PSBB066]QSE67779.1 oxidoreductase [Rhodococcus sp. PSBB049]